MIIRIVVDIVHNFDYLHIIDRAYLLYHSSPAYRLRPIPHLFGSESQLLRDLQHLLDRFDGLLLYLLVHEYLRHLELQAII